MSKVFLALGSNKGDRKEYLRNAIQMLDEKVNLLKISNVYETKPYGNIPQENYLNAMVLVETELLPNEIYFFVKEIEKKVGRKKSVKWGEREIDIDIIMIDSLILENDLITIPHKEFEKRDFVLKPLCDIAPDTSSPIDGEKLIDKLKNINDKYIIKRVEFDLDYLGELN